MPDQNQINQEATTNQNTPAKKHFFRASAADFKKIPGSPIAYWVNKRIIEIFNSHEQIYKISISDGQNITANNDRYLRFHWEIANIKIQVAGKWSFYSKGGPFRKWFGNLDYVVDWSEEARINYSKHPSARIIPEYLRFRDGITWTLITSSKQSFRFLPDYSTFDKGGSSIFFNETSHLYKTLLFLNTKISEFLTKLFNATLNLQVDDVRKLPLSPELIQIDDSILERILIISKNDWDSYETSWDFTELPLLQAEYMQSSLEQTYQLVREHWKQMCIEMKNLEEENNRIFIEAYGLQDELTPEVPWREITLTCNPFYRYSKKAETADDGNEETVEEGEEYNETGLAEEENNDVSSVEFPIDAEIEERLLGDTMRELISYAVGCMFGRYSLDKPGLILADQGQTIEDYLAKIPEPTFMPDRENVLPILEDEYFTDDIAERFKKFIKTAFGENNYQKNLEFVEKAIGKDIRRYFVKDFYNDHVKRYKKRPIYWLFSSPSGSFNALIYLHRYRPDTASQVLNHYLRVYIEKINTRNRDLEQLKNSASATPREQNHAAKEIEKNKKILRELDAYEREIVFPLAAKRLEIDLDNGVKQNYPLLGKALKKITGI